jgi:hypothetical protein
MTQPKPHTVRLYRTTGMTLPGGAKASTPRDSLIWAASCKNCSFATYRGLERERDRMVRFHMEITGRNLSLSDSLMIGDKIIKRLGGAPLLYTLKRRRDGYRLNPVTDTLIDLLPKFSAYHLEAAAQAVKLSASPQEVLRDLIQVSWSSHK